MTLYKRYVTGRDEMRLVFKQHRTHAAFTEASENGLFAAWKKACEDNVGKGNSYLPASGKVLLEVLGVLLVALYSYKRWSFIAFLALLLLSQTASEESSEGEYDAEYLEYEDSMLFDRMADMYGPVRDWPDCSCTECRGGCPIPAALPNGGLCTNCRILRKFADSSNGSEKVENVVWLAEHIGTFSTDVFFPLSANLRKIQLIRHKRVVQFFLKEGISLLFVFVTRGRSM